MQIHIALYEWKNDALDSEINLALRRIASLSKKIPGIVEITCAKNESRYSEGYTHVIFVRAQNRAAIDAYRSHSDHKKIAQKLETMEDHGIGVDFTSSEME